MTLHLIAKRDRSQLNISLASGAPLPGYFLVEEYIKQTPALYLCEVLPFPVFGYPGLLGPLPEHFPFTQLTISKGFKTKRFYHTRLGHYTSLPTKATVTWVLAHVILERSCQFPVGVRSALALPVESPGFCPIALPNIAPQRVQDCH